MKSFNRAIIHVIRSRRKTVLLFLILFFLGNLIVGSYAIKQSSEISINNIKSKVAPNITVHATVGFDSNNQNKVTQALMHMNDDRIQYVDISYRDALSFENLYHFDLTSYDYSYIIINTVNNVDYYDLKYNNIAIIEGRNFTNDEIENGSNVIIIDENYRRKNQKNELEKIEIGEHIFLEKNIEITPYTCFSQNNNKKIYKELVAYEVIGKFKNNNQNLLQDNNFWYDVKDFTNITYSSPTNSGAYIPTNTLKIERKKMLDIINEIKKEIEVPNGFVMKESPRTNEMEIDHIFIKLNDSNDLIEFCKDLKNLFNVNGIYDIEIFSTNDTYELIIAPLGSLSKLSELFFYCSIIVSIVILCLVIFLFVRDRKKEIGLYIALGEKKKNIILQIICEIYLVGILTLSCSIITGYKFGEIITKFTLNNEILTQEEVINEKLQLLQSVNSEQLGLEILDKEVEFAIELEYIVYLYIIESLVLILSIVFSLKYILMINPKEILL